MGHEERHGICKNLFIWSICIHDHDGTILLERLIVQGCLLFEAELARVVHDAVVVGPGRVCVIGARRGKALEIWAIRTDGAYVEVGIADGSAEDDLLAIWWPSQQIVSFVCEISYALVVQINDYEEGRRR